MMNEGCFSFEVEYAQKPETSLPVPRMSESV